MVEADTVQGQTISYNSANTTTGSAIFRIIIKDGQAPVTGTHATVEITNEAVNVNICRNEIGDNFFGSD
jgi:hypothetical protein